MGDTNNWIRQQASRNTVDPTAPAQDIRAAAMRGTVSVTAPAPRHPGMNDAIRLAAGYPKEADR